MSMSDMTKRAIDASLAEIGRVVVLEAERDRYRQALERVKDAFDEANKRWPFEESGRLPIMRAPLAEALAALKERLS